MARHDGREGKCHVGGPHDAGLGLPAVVAGDETPEPSENHSEEGGAEADDDRDLTAVNDPRQQVTTVLVRSEPMVGARGGIRCCRVGGVGVLERQPVGGEHGHHDQNEDAGGDPELDAESPLDSLARYLGVDLTHRRHGIGVHLSGCFLEQLIGVVAFGERRAVA